MAAKRQKPDDQRVFKRPSRETRTVAIVPNADNRIMPACPRGLHPVARQWWKDLWASPLAQVIDLSADGDAIRDWAYCISRREECEAELRDNPFTTGSTGQLQNHPIINELKLRRQMIEKYRDHYGGTALSRMRLGIAYSEADAALDRMQKRRQGFEPVMVDVSDDGVIAVSS